jgi:hypothetical protein
MERISTADHRRRSWWMKRKASQSPGPTPARPQPMTDLDREKLMMVATTAIAALLWALANLS